MYIVSIKRQNGKTNPVQIFCSNSYDPREAIWMKNLIEKKLLKFKIYENPQIEPEKFAKVCSSENDEKIF